ncbi:MAG: phosphate ABC transporter permease PstA [Promethearchaeota archaeon]
MTSSVKQINLQAVELFTKNQKKPQILEKLIKRILFVTAIFSVIIVFIQILFFIKEAGGTIYFINFINFFTGKKWKPIKSIYGVLPLIIGSVLVTFGTLIIAVPLSLVAAVFISEMLPSKFKSLFKVSIEILSGIPSVVYGFFGLIVLSPFLKNTFNRPTGQSWFAGSIILSIMVIPTIVSVSEDAISAIPNDYREAAIGIGSTKWQTISKVVLPAALPGITTAIILGAGRAIGETMAVMMVTGNSVMIPHSLFDIWGRVRTITATIAIEMPEVAVGDQHYSVLFLLVLLLFGIIVFLNFLAEKILKKFYQKLNSSEKNQKHNKKYKQQIKNKKIYQLQQFFDRNKTLLMYITGEIFVFWMISSWWNYLGALILTIIITGTFLGIKRFSPKIQEKLVFSTIYIVMSGIIFIIVIILSNIIRNGLPALSWDFISKFPRDLGRSGGIFPAIFGTLQLTFGAILFSVPMGVLAGIYLSEYAKENKFTRIIHLAIDNLNGTPSIVFGIFGLVVFCIFFGWGKSLLAGQITLSLMILPTIIRTSEESFHSVPNDLREGSYALGATKSYTIRKVVLPSASPGILTGIILSMGRAVGETAPIMFTAVVFSVRNISLNPMRPVMALPYFLYILTTTVPESSVNSYGTALVLLILVILLFSIAMFVRSKLKEKKRSNFQY